MANKAFEKADRWLNEQGLADDLKKPYYMPDIRVAYIEGYHEALVDACIAVVEGETVEKMLEKINGLGRVS